MAAKSIMTTYPGTCYWCHREVPTHLHHIYFGHGKRPVSDRLGFVVYLCPECHEGTNGVHGKNGHGIDTTLKQLCQTVYETEHTREEFIQEIGRSYL